MAWDDGLTGVHREIAASDHRRIGVLAGPGTGKTAYGLLRRVARLLEEGKCAPEEILLLTFTRTAAHDLVDKIADLGSQGADQVGAGTVHGFCFGMLRKEAVLEVTNRQTRMLLEHEAKLMLRDLRGEFGTLAERLERLRAFEAGWARAKTDHPGLALDPSDVSFEAQILSWLRRHRAMLIGEVVPIAYQYLKNNPQAEERTKFKHVIVDEYQDLNTLEQRLIDLLVGPDASLCVAGDDDQSIYRFRYAHPDGIVLFVNDQDTEGRTILECRRCPEPILRLANSLIEQAGSRSKPPLTCAQTSPGSVSIVQWSGLQDEIDGIVAAVAFDIAQERREAGDFLILVNRREVGYRIRSALVEQRIEAHSFFQDNALRKSNAAQQSLALLQLLVTIEDRPALRVWLGFGDQEGRANAYSRLRGAATEEGVAELEMLEQIANRSKKLNVPALVKRYQELKTAIDRLRGLELPDLVDELLPEGDHDVELLREAALPALEKAGSAADVLDELLRVITQPEVPQRPDFVRVMSLHKSKGLTSPVVIVAMASAHVIPTIRDSLPDNEEKQAFEEGRRLFYVALTRSKDEVVISYPFEMLVKDAYSMGISPEMVWKRGDELVARVLATPYLTELGSEQPAALRGEDWLQARTREAS